MTVLLRYYSWNKHELIAKIVTATIGIGKIKLVVRETVIALIVLEFYIQLVWFGWRLYNLGMEP
jgi:hypothetical protein